MNSSQFLKSHKIFITIFLVSTFVLSISIISTRAEITQTGSSHLAMSAIDQNLTLHGAGDEEFNTQIDMGTISPRQLDFEKEMILENSGNVDIIYNLYSLTYEDDLDGIERVLQSSLYIDDELVHSGVLSEMKMQPRVIAVNEKVDIRLVITWPVNGEDIRQYSGNQFWIQLAMDTSLTNGDKGFLSPYNLFSVIGTVSSWMQNIELLQSFYPNEIYIFTPDPSDANGTLVEYSKNSDFSSSSIVTFPNETPGWSRYLTVNDLEPNTEYFFRARSVTMIPGVELSEMWSDTVSIVTLPPENN